MRLHVGTCKFDFKPADIEVLCKLSETTKYTYNGTDMPHMLKNQELHLNNLHTTSFEAKTIVLNHQYFIVTVEILCVAYSLRPS